MAYPGGFPGYPLPPPPLIKKRKKKEKQKEEKDTAMITLNIIYCTINASPHPKINDICMSFSKC